MKLVVLCTCLWCAALAADADAEPCSGAPCPSDAHCRSKWGHCGGGDAYCNGSTIWRKECASDSGASPTQHPSTVDAPTRSPSNAPANDTVTEEVPESSGNTIKALISALSNTNYIFQLIANGGPSTVYKWEHMVSGVEKMATEGVGGDTLFAGTDAPDGYKYGMVGVAAFLAQSMQETIQYDACDENNWSDQATVSKAGGTVYPATSACGQLGQSYENYKCAAGSKDEDGNLIPPEELQCEVDPNMEIVAYTSAAWYGAPPPLFCAPKSRVAKAPRWSYNGWCPTTTVFDQKTAWANDGAFATRPLGTVHYGEGPSTENVPPSLLSKYPTYIDYVLGSVDKGTGAECQLAGQCCLDVANQRAGSWESCEGGGCSNAPAPLHNQPEGRTDVEGCCWWGRGVIQTTGVCNFGKLNYFLGAKAKARGRPALYPDVDFCKDPEVICRDEHPDLKWLAGLYYWIESVQPTNTGGHNFLQTLKRWVDNGSNLHDTSLIDMASGLVNRGCPTLDGCGNGPVDAVEERRHNFETIMNAFGANYPSGGLPRPPTTSPPSVAPPPSLPPTPSPSSAAPPPRTQPPTSAIVTASPSTPIVDTHSPTASQPTADGSRACGDPCPIDMQCRSKWGWCGAGASYCNADSLWTKDGCASIPTAPSPPATTTASPTTTDRSPVDGALIAQIIKLLERLRDEGGDETRRQAQSMIDRLRTLLESNAPLTAELAAEVRTLAFATGNTLDESSQELLDTIRAPPPPPPADDDSAKEADGNEGGGSLLDAPIMAAIAGGCALIVAIAVAAIVVVRKRMKGEANEIDEKRRRREWLDAAGVSALPNKGKLSHEVLSPGGGGPALDSAFPPEYV